MTQLSARYCWFRNEDGKKCPRRAVWRVSDERLYVCKTHGVQFLGRLEEIRPQRKRGLPGDVVRLNKGLDGGFGRAIKR